MNRPARGDLGPARAPLRLPLGTAVVGYARSSQAGQARCGEVPAAGLPCRAAPARNVWPVGSSQPELARRVVSVDGVSRAYFSRGAAAASTGIVLCLHGSRSTAARQAWFSGMDSLRGDGMTVVYPQADVAAGRGYAWDHERDLAYLAAVVEQVRAELGAAASPVFLAGMSGGARMACTYAAARADEVAAVAAVAGLRSPEVRPARPVPIVAFHGLADRINPYPGGRGDRWRESVPEAAAAWATANGVETSQTATEPGPGLTKITYGEGTPGEVTL